MIKIISEVWVEYPSKKAFELADKFLWSEYEPQSEEELKEISLALVAMVTRNEQDWNIWLDCPHPDLGNRTSRAVIESGRAGAVATMLHNAMHGIPS